MSSEESYLPDFFTPERLEWYRDLSQRFPLWCGIWPEEEINLPEAWMWSPDRFVWTELDESEDQFLGFWFTPTPTLKLMPRPVLTWTEPNPLGGTEPEEPPLIEHHASVTEPLAYAAWFAALNYISHDWSKDPPKPRTKRRVTNDSEHFLDPLKEVLTRHPIEKLNQHGINRRRREVLNATPGKERKKAIKKLEAYWIRIGRAAHVLPSTRGGPLTTLPNAMLAALMEEAKGIAAEVRKFEPDAEAMHALRPLREGSEAEPDEVQKGYLEELAKRYPELAERRIALGESRQDDDDASDWVTVLRYPFLTADEIDAVRSAPAGRDSAPTTLLSKRLPIDRTTLLKRLSQA